MPAAGAGLGGATWAPAEAQPRLVRSGVRVMGDAWYVFVTFRWDEAGLRALRRYTADGLRYTQEVNDLTGRLSATGFWMSDLPGARFDRDDDEGDGRWEEAEVTSADPARLRAETDYTVGIQLSRWWEDCSSDPCRLRWSFRSGRVALLSQLSRFFLGEWQAVRYTLPWAVLRSPSEPRPARSPARPAVGETSIRFAGFGPSGAPAVCAGPAGSPDPVAICQALGLAWHHPVAVTASARIDTAGDARGQRADRRG